MQLFAMTCGWIEADRHAFLEGETGRIRVPIPCYLIVHPRGAVLFDTGLHVATQADPEKRLGFLARVYEVHFRPGEELAARLAALGVDARRIEHLVLSHLHFDHVGGVAAVPNARLVVQRREWAAGRDPDLAPANGYDARDYDLGHDVLAVDGEHDLFGDGRVVCLPTWGHTPGHQSLRLRVDGGEVVLAADACYLAQTLDELRLPPFAHDREAMLAALARLRALRAAGVRILYGHDPDLWRTVPQAPAELHLRPI